MENVLLILPSRGTSLMLGQDISRFADSISALYDIAY